MVGACRRALRAALLPAALFTAALAACCVLMAFVDSARASAATFAPLSMFGTGGSGDGQIDQLPRRRERTVGLLGDRLAQRLLKRAWPEIEQRHA
jgi:hypothetical protein